MRSKLALLLTIFTNPAFASNMGNGPATIQVWVIGGLLALAYAYYSSCEEGENGEVNFVNKKRFFILLLVLTPIVFVLGVVALFVFA